MHDLASEIVSIADACLGGLAGRSALLVGPEEQRRPYLLSLRHAKMKYVYEEENADRVALLIPLVQLLICVPSPAAYAVRGRSTPLITAASVARGCEGRRTPLLIFDLAPTTSVEELAGLLPAVCLYTPQDLCAILGQIQARAS